MTPNQITCIQRSFQTLSASAPPVAQFFYMRLAQLSPDLNSRFNGQGDNHGRKLIAMLGTAVRSLHNIEGLKVVSCSLARRYSNQGVEPKHFNLLSHALLETLEMALGDEFTGDVAAAWTALSELLLETTRESEPRNQLKHCPWGKEVPMALAVTP